MVTQGPLNDASDKDASYEELQKTNFFRGSLIFFLNLGKDAVRN